MKDMLKTAAILATVAFIAAGILAFTEKVTRDPIRLVSIKKKANARETLVKAKSFTLYLQQVIKAEDAENGIIKPLKDRDTLASFHSCYEKSGQFFILKNTASESDKSLLLDAAVKAGISAHFFADIVAASSKIGGTAYKHLARFVRIYAGTGADGLLAGFVFECTAPEGYGGDIEMVTGVTLNSNGKAEIEDYIVIKSGETPGLGKKAEDVLHNTLTNSKRTIANYSPTDREKDVVTGATITSLAVKDALFASLQLASVLKDRLSPAVNIPEGFLKMIPYGTTLEAMTNTLPTTLHALYTAKFYTRTMGWVSLIPVQEFNSNKGAFINRMVAVAVQNGNAKVMGSRVFEYDTASKSWPVVNLASLFFYNKTENDLKKDIQDEKDPLRKKAIAGILDMYSAIRGGGR